MIFLSPKLINYKFEMVCFAICLSHGFRKTTIKKTTIKKRFYKYVKEFWITFLEMLKIQK